MTNFTMEFPFDQETRKLSIGPAFLAPPGHVNLFVSRPRIDEEWVLSTVEVGVNLSPEQQRELAHELLRRLGDPVPEPPAKAPQPGDWYRGARTGSLYQLIHLAEGQPDGYWLTDLYRKIGAADSAHGYKPASRCTIGLASPVGQRYLPVKVHVETKTLTVPRVVE